YSVLITTAVSSKITPEDVKKASTDGYSSLRTGLTEIQKTGASYAPVAMDAAGKAVTWVQKNPVTTAGIAVGAVAFGAPGIISGPVLYATGFGSGGVAGGQSLFATLQSAGAGGAGVAVVNTAIQGTGVVIGGAVAATRASMTSVAGNGLEWIRSKL
ncbi:hypothetical protein DH86_00002876, partial [Scytalidium sp. 3C]